MCHQSKSQDLRSTNSRTKSHKPINHVEEQSDSEVDWVNAVRKHESERKYDDLKCEMLVGNKTVAFQIDTGASVNILPVHHAPYVHPTNKKLTMWNGNQFTPVGVCRTKLQNPKNNKRYSVEFVVVEGDRTPLIGLSAAEQMKLITVNNDKLNRVLQVSDQSVTGQFTDVFDGKLGRLEGKVHLRVRDEVYPVVMPTRRMPLAVRPKLKAELERMTEAGIIVPVTEPTPWVSQMVATPKKNGDIRICIDPRELNKALIRERFTLPILDDALHELGQSRFFSKADLSAGFHHVELDYESSLLTTFQTYYGRYRWTRLPFGLSVSSEIFGRKLLEALDGLTGVICIADDVIVHGRDEREHDARLAAFLQRCRERGIQLNRDKFVLMNTEITFMGHRITSAGLQADPEKVKAITEMKSPTNVEELRRFLGLVNYLGKFLPHFSAVAEPLRNLTKNQE